SRVVIVAYNPYLRWLFTLATMLKLRSGEMPVTFLTRTDLDSIARLSGFEVVRIRSVGSLLHFVPVLSWLLESLLKTLPILKQLCFVSVIVLRPIMPETTPPSLTVVIPARNEKGNMEPALQRLTTWNACPLEIVMVEGNSTDGTWE